MRRLLSLVAFLATFACCIGAAQAGAVVNPQYDATIPTDPQAAMQLARDRVAGGDLNGAIIGLATYVFAHPGQAAPERLLGDLYFRHGDLRKAENVYLHILTYVPGDKETHSRLGSVYATENRIDDAITEFNRSLPGTDSVNDLVQLHMRKGDFKQYEREREMIAREYPTDPEAQLELSQVYEATHRPQQAMLYVRRALDNDPTSIRAMNVLGLAYLDERNFPEAIRQFQECLRRDPFDYPCEDNLGATYLESGAYADASRVLNQAHTMAPERSEALVNLGYLADVHGDWKRAVQFYVLAMTVYPYSPDAYIDLGYTYNMHGEYQLAQAALIKGLAVAPLDGRLHFLLGDAYQHLGKEALAKAEFKTASSDYLNPDVQRMAQERVATLERIPQVP